MLNLDLIIMIYSLNNLQKVYQQKIKEKTLLQQKYIKKKIYMLATHF